MVFCQNVGLFFLASYKQGRLLRKTFSNVRSSDQVQCKQSLCEHAFRASAFMHRYTGFYDLFWTVSGSSAAVELVLKVKLYQTLTNWGLRFGSDG